MSRPAFSFLEHEDGMEFMIADAFAEDRISERDRDMFGNGQDFRDESLYEKHWHETEENGREKINFQDRKGFPKDCVVYLFGCTEQGNSVMARTLFRPYHYVEIPDKWNDFQIKMFFEHLNSILFRYGFSKLEYDIGHHHRMYGWEPDPNDHSKRRLYKTAKVSYPTIAHMKWATKLLTVDGHKLKSPDKCPFLGEKISFAVHESSKVPIIHKIFDQYGWKASGWIRLPKGSFSLSDGGLSTCQVEIDFQASLAIPLLDKETVPPLVLASFDIESYNPDESGKPPVSTDPLCKVSMIGVTVQRFGTTDTRRIVFSLLPVSSEPTPQAVSEGKAMPIEFRTFDGDEKAMCLAFRDCVCHEIDADVITGYNLNGYDYRFLGERFAKLFVKQPQLTSRFFHWSRLASMYGPLLHEESSSMAKGDRVKCSFPMIGRISIDMLAIVSDPTFPEDFVNFKLDTVAEKLLGRNKIDLNMQDMFKLFEGRFTKRFLMANHGMAKSLLPQEHWPAEPMMLNTVPAFTLSNKGLEDDLERMKAYNDAKRDHDELMTEQRRQNEILMTKYGENLYDAVMKQGQVADPAVLRRRLGEYCSVDCDLPLEIMENTNTLMCAIQMSRKTMTLTNDVVNRGQQIKVYQLLVSYSHKIGFVVNDAPASMKNGKYKGAKVLSPEARFYDRPIITEDFASLYPSIMRAEGYCPSTFVVDPKHKEYKDVNYKRVDVQNGTGIVHSFVCNKDSVCSMILKDLGDERKRVRDLEKKESLASMKRNYDAQQKACKVVMNSIYGFFGVDPKMALMPCVAVAECVTFTGRCMIETTKRLIEEHFSKEGAHVVYGDTDSVMVDMVNVKQEPGESNASFMARMFEYGHAMSKLVTDHFAKATGKSGIIKLEFEKVYSPYLLLQKKTYAAAKYESLTKPPVIDVKGIVLVKSSTCTFVKDVMECIMTPLFFEKSIPRVVEAINRIIVKFRDGKIPDEDFIHYVKLSANYADRTSHPQCVVADKIKTRTPGSEPKPGDMVAYLPVMDRGQQLANMVEDPACIKANNLAINYLYIIEHRLVEVLASMLRFLPIDMDKLMKPLISAAARKSSTSQSVCTLMGEQETDPPLYTLTDQEVEQGFAKMRMAEKNELKQQGLELSCMDDDHEDGFFSLLSSTQRSEKVTSKSTNKRKAQTKSINVYEIDGTSMSSIGATYEPERLKRAKKNQPPTNNMSLLSFFTNEEDANLENF